MLRTTRLEAAKRVQALENELMALREGSTELSTPTPWRPEIHDSETKLRETTLIEERTDLLEHVRDMKVLAHTALLQRTR